MELKSQQEVARSRAKLERAIKQYNASKARANSNEVVQELSLRSLKRIINQMTEDIAHFEARNKVGTEA